MQRLEPEVFQRHQDHRRLLNPIQARLQHSRLPYTSTRSDTRNQEIHKLNLQGYQWILTVPNGLHGLVDGI